MKYLLFIPLLLLAALLSSCEAPGEAARSPKSDLRLQKVGVFNEPLWIEALGERLLVVEKDGKIISFRDGQKSTWLDITDEVRNYSEGGLLSMALSPAFGEDRLFYVYYTNRDGNQVVAEGIADPRPRLRRTVLEMEDFRSNHNGGQISFGPGGLYIATGDGGGSGDPERTAQNPGSLLGKILRIDPSGDPYAIPKDNPFVGGGGRPEIFSLGLRNPWRFSIGGGRLWIGDVGQDRQEEISAPTLRRARGGNFGWSAWEGRLRFNKDQSVSDPIWPVLVYGDRRGCSVTGGYWVRRLGSLRNRYLYGDFCTGKIRSFRLEEGRARGDRSEGITVPALASFARSGDRIWAISLEGGIWRLR